MKVIQNSYTIKMNMKKYLFIATILLATAGCSSIDAEPPRKEGSMNKEYKLPDPAPLTADQREEYNRRNQEYHNNVNR